MLMTQHCLEFLTPDALTLTFVILTRELDKISDWLKQISFL